MLLNVKFVVCSIYFKDVVQESYPVLEKVLREIELSIWVLIVDGKQTDMDVSI